MWKIFSGVMLSLILISTLTIVFNIKSAKAEWTGTVYIRADGSIDPPDAPITTYDNFTYTLMDNITSSADGIVIERNNTVFDGNGYSIIGVGSGSGISCDGVNNITVRNTKIHNFHIGMGFCLVSNCSIYGNDVTNVAVNDSYGMLFGGSTYNTIFNNNITNCKYGIGVGTSSHNSILENQITQSGWGIGIIFDYFSDYNNVCGNTITIYGDGIRMRYSSFNNISWNMFDVSNNLGILVDESSCNSFIGNVFITGGLFVESSFHNVVLDNIINGKPLVYLEEALNVTVVEAGQVILVNCSHIKIENLNISSTIAAIELFETRNTTITNCVIRSNDYGIAILYSNDTDIVENQVIENWYGINFYKAFHNNISGNNISNNNDFGIHSVASSFNTIFINCIANNSEGIVLDYSSNFNIVGNYIKNNRYVGIFIYLSSAHNRIYHNNFINNEQHAIAGEFNTWDAGYPDSGNYWSNYKGVDYYSGPYQNETGSDGIGDIPYVIDVNNIDRYPLMAPFTTFSAGVWNEAEYFVDVASNSTISGFVFDPSKGPYLKFNVAGDDGTIGFCRVTIPKSLLWAEDGWTITVGNQQITDYSETADENNTYLYFTYQHSTHTIVIQGTNVIPEFPLTLCLGFLILIAIPLIFAKKKRFKKANT